MDTDYKNEKILGAVHSFFLVLPIAIILANVFYQVNEGFNLTSKKQ